MHDHDINAVCCTIVVLRKPSSVHMSVTTGLINRAWDSTDLEREQQIKRLNNTLACQFV